MNLFEFMVAFSLGVFCALFLRQVIVTAWRWSYFVPKNPPTNIVDAENVVRIQKWKERRQEIDKTFGRRA